MRHTIFKKGNSSFNFIAVCLIIAIAAGASAVIIQNRPNTAHTPQTATLEKPAELLDTSNKSQPPVLSGIKLYADNPFKFEFIMEEGDKILSDEELKNEAATLVNYFLAGLTVPEEDLWVNLSPVEADRIVPNELGRTDLGQDMLAQDYVLKKLSSSLIYPDGDLGQQYWQKIYAKAEETYGTANIPIDTFNKVWIMPESASIYEDKDKAFITESKLKVMMEQDYLALSNSKQLTDKSERKPHAVNDIASKIMREVILPEIERDVNEGKNFAKLRQIYRSLLLATWFKKKLKDHIVSQLAANKKKIAGVTADDPNAKEKIYNQYVEMYKTGLYDYVKKDYDPSSNQYTNRRYFSGGIVADTSDVVASGTKPIDKMSKISTIGKTFKSILAIIIATVALTMAKAPKAQDEYMDFTGNTDASGHVAQFNPDKTPKVEEDALIMGGTYSDLLVSIMQLNLSDTSAFLREKASIELQSHEKEYTTANGKLYFWITFTRNGVRVIPTKTPPQPPKDVKKQGPAKVLNPRKGYAFAYTVDIKNTKIPSWVGNVPGIMAELGKIAIEYGQPTADAIKGALTRTNFKESDKIQITAHNTNGKISIEIKKIGTIEPSSGTTGLKGNYGGIMKAAIDPLSDLNKEHGRAVGKAIAAALRKKPYDNSITLEVTWSKKNDGKIHITVKNLGPASPQAPAKPLIQTKVLMVRGRKTLQGLFVANESGTTLLRNPEQTKEILEAHKEDLARLGYNVDEVTPEQARRLIDGHETGHFLMEIVNEHMRSGVITTPSHSDLSDWRKSAVDLRLEGPPTEIHRQGRLEQPPSTLLAPGSGSVNHHPEFTSQLRFEEPPFIPIMSQKAFAELEDHYADIFAISWAFGRNNLPSELADQIESLETFINEALAASYNPSRLSNLWEHLQNDNPSDKKDPKALEKFLEDNLGINVTVEDASPAHMETLLDAHEKAGATTTEDTAVGGIDLTREITLKLQGQGMTVFDSYKVDRQTIDSFPGFEAQILEIKDIFSETSLRAKAGSY
ncbi:MAG: hypothetical protein GY858_04440 [Candidatus Omnitrophica bacterium]|nr:hypothetical protein [Candidatus Omnitrophota bacterium]